MDIVNAYEELGSYRAAAALCKTTHKTVKRVVERRARGQLVHGRSLRPKNTDTSAALVGERVRLTDGRISAKRLLPVARAAGYEGSARNFRRVVAAAKRSWKTQRRTYRPWVPVPGEHLVIDWSPVDGAPAAYGAHGLQTFCAVLSWSRYRFVRFGRDQRRETTLGFLAECFGELGGVPAVVLADRMGCLKAGVVANVVVPHPEYVRFASHYGFRPDFCEAADPESKGVVEALVRYAQQDLVTPALATSATGDLSGWNEPGPALATANAAARRWCAEVNAQRHSEIAAVPAERLVTEQALLRPLPSLAAPPPGLLESGARRKVDRLATVRFGSARYSVPRELVGQRVALVVADGQISIRHADHEVARHRCVAPGEVALDDSHYGGAVTRPVRAVRPRSETEHAFLGLGSVAEPFLRRAAAAGTARLASELAEILTLAAAWDRPSLVAALERALVFRRFSAAGVRAILEAGVGVGGLPTLARAGTPLPLLALSLPAVPVRPLADYALTSLVAAPPAPAAQAAQAAQAGQEVVP